MRNYFNKEHENELNNMLFLYESFQQLNMWFFFNHFKNV